MNYPRLQTLREESRELTRATSFSHTIASAREWTNNRVVLLLSFAEVYASALLRVHAYTQSELPE